MIGDIIPCPEWYHGDHCTNEDCKRGWRERGEDQHRDCQTCNGAKEVRIVEERPGFLQIEPVRGALR